MSVITQPDAEVSYTGQTNAGTVSGSTQLLQTILTALQGGGVTTLPDRRWDRNLVEQLYAVHSGFRSHVSAVHQHQHFSHQQQFPDERDHSGRMTAHAAGKQVCHQRSLGIQRKQ
jgi:hypothetical protein